MNWTGKKNLDIIHEIGATLKDRRIKYKLSQEELSQISGISKPTLNRIENGKANMKIESLISLFRVLGMLDGLNDLFRKANMLNDLAPERNRAGEKKERVRKTNSNKATSEEWIWGDEKTKK